jgi:nitrogen-specific signal transduction histidine kinase/ActR/RegA family two-component response regulator
MVHESRQKYHKLRAKRIGKRNRSDVTERRQAEIKTQLLHEKLALFSQIATFSELTAWLAHELNQPLAAILGNAQAALRLMERGSPDPREFRAIFNDIVADNRRAVEILRSMRSELKRGVTENKTLPLNDLIKEILPVVRNDSLVKNVSIELDLGVSLPSIAGDRIQLQQVVFNLIFNALEAIKTSERPGKLILRTRHAGGEVVLDVVDSGTGIPNERLNSIFDPLVTTKAEALGMGLPLSRSIVIRHNGRLWAENNIDGGATFHVALPVEDSLTFAPTAGVDQNFQSDSGQRLRGFTVLIADDGETFRRAVSSILADLPELKNLAEAADGAEAIKMAAELNPDLVLLDVGLPIVNGVEAAAKIRAVAPNAKLIFLTQHDSPDFVSAAMRAGALGYVLKVDVGSELLQAAMAVVRGEQYLSSGIRR